MNLETLKTWLAKGVSKELRIRLTPEENLAAHFHVTEVGRVAKDFVDCGGVRRSSETCVVQTYVANDFDHRLPASKLLGILEKSDVLGLTGSIEVEIEVQGRTIETYSIADATIENEQLIFQASAKRTACLAPDSCGLPVVSISGTSSCEPSSGCC